MPEGYRAFIPKRLPPDPPLEFDTELVSLLSKANHAVGRLDGIAVNLPDTDLFVGMYVRKEAVLSSQIEGTQASLLDLIEYEARAVQKGEKGALDEVVNYIAAMKLGLDNLGDGRITLDLLKRVHGRLMEGVRGSERWPGEFRPFQNWIGPPGCAINEAHFVPPPPKEMMDAMEGLEIFINRPSELPSLVTSGLVHAAFETVHPFLDGNGRVGRLLITLQLCQDGTLTRPLLYLSYYLKANRKEYYERLMRVREDGDWEGWLRFYLTGIDKASEQATESIRSILDLKQHHKDLIVTKTRTKALELHDLLFRRPIISVPLVAKELGVSFPTASTAVGRLMDLGILEEREGPGHPRLYSYAEYLRLVTEGTAPL